MSSRASISHSCSSPEIECAASGKDEKATSDRDRKATSDRDGKVVDLKDKVTSDRDRKGTSDRNVKASSDRDRKIESVASDQESTRAPKGDGGAEAGSSIFQESYTADASEQTQVEVESTSEVTAQESLTAKSVAPARVNGTGKKLSIVRHAERMDRVFKSWIIDTGIDNGSYLATDLNQPLKMPRRKSGGLSWLLDPPLTEIGRMSAQILGRGLKKKLFRCTYIYASPSYRCIQTAVEICNGMSQEVPIRVEPGLFEWMHWYRDSEPEWLKIEEMQSLKWNIDTDYDPMMTPGEILSNKTETLADCYDRINRVTTSIAEGMAGETSTLIVAHGLNVDAGTRGLRGMSTDPPDQKRLVQMGLFYPYLCFVQVEEKTDGTWRAVDNPVPPLSHLDVTNRIDPMFYTRP